MVIAFYITEYTGEFSIHHCRTLGIHPKKIHYLLMLLGYHCRRLHWGVLIADSRAAMLCYACFCCPASSHPIAWGDSIVCYYWYFIIHQWTLSTGFSSNSSSWTFYGCGDDFILSPMIMVAAPERTILCWWIMQVGRKQGHHWKILSKIYINLNLIIVLLETIQSLTGIQKKSWISGSNVCKRKLVIWEK